MSGVISAAALKTIGVDGIINQLYSNERQAMNPVLDALMARRNAKSNYIQYAGLEDVDIPAPWLDGAAIPTSTIDDISDIAYVDRLGRELTWRIEDEIDDQLGALGPRVAELGKEFAHVEYRAIAECSTDSLSMLQTAPTDYLGLSLFSSSSSHGGSGGNIGSGRGVGSPDAISKDFYDAKAWARTIPRRTAPSEKFWGTDSTEIGKNANWVCIFPGSGTSNGELERTVYRALGGERILDQSGLGVIANEIVKLGGPQILFWPRLTGSDWFMFYVGNQAIKPFLWADRSADGKSEGGGPVYLRSDESNSDFTRTYFRRKAGWVRRYAFAPFAWQCAFKIDN